MLKRTFDIHIVFKSGTTVKVKVRRFAADTSNDEITEVKWTHIRTLSQQLLYARLSDIDCIYSRKRPWWKF